jgi:hypothetical protein
MSIKSNIFVAILIICLTGIFLVQNSVGYSINDPADDLVYQVQNDSNPQGTTACRLVDKYQWLNVIQLSWFAIGMDYVINVTFATNIETLWNDTSTSQALIFINLNGTGVTSNTLGSAQVQISALGNYVMGTFNDGDEWDKNPILNIEKFGNNLSVTFEQRLCENMSNALSIDNWYVYMYSIQFDMNTRPGYTIIYMDMVNVPFYITSMFPVCSDGSSTPTEEKKEEEDKSFFKDIEGFNIGWILLSFGFISVLIKFKLKYKRE